MNTEESIARYLADTYSIREITKAFEPLNPEEAGASRSILAPWSLHSISGNTGATIDQIREFLDGNGSFSVAETEVDGIKFKIAKAKGNPAGTSGGTSLEAGTHLSVSQLMNLHVLQYVNSRVSDEDAPVKIEDAIFDLKNTVFLPDDFMPEHLMGMVEGDANFTLEEIRENYAVKEGITSLYFYQEQKNDGQGRIRFLYPSKSGAINGAPGNEKIRELISGSFSSIQTEKSYIDFVNSRLIKTIIFNMEQKGNRELKSPIFNPGKIKILEDMGLVERSDEKAFIKQSVSVDRLKEIYSKAKADGQELAEAWLSSKVEVE